MGLLCRQLRTQYCILYRTHYKVGNVYTPFLFNYFTNHTPYIKNVYEKHVHFCPQNFWSVKHLACNGQVKVKLHTDTCIGLQCPLLLCNINLK